MVTKKYFKKYKGKKKRRIYKRFIEIKTNRKGWTKVELLSVNKGGTITIKTIDGHIIKRKIKNVRWSPTIHIYKKCGIKPTIPLKTIKQKKKKRKKRRVLKVRSEQRQKTL